MTISVIIVNYNVKYFLEQCLYSIQAALKNIPGEIIVVDNASSDNSVAYVQPKFPSVKFLTNTKNTGFGAGCNLGFKISSGEFVVFLNPDSLVTEDCFEKCISFIKTHPEAGALGVKMLDGSGNFLKESKRGFPSLSASFFKLAGLTQLFPHSKWFSKYYLGHLDESKNSEIDVLAGAFMIMKRGVFEKVGGFDESFFMYGEDIDLSYRIQKAGFRNYYLGETEILHFKGESTNKEGIDYVRMFYNAMSIFVNKHYKGGLAWLYKIFIHAGIWLAAFIAAIKNSVSGLFHSNSNKAQFIAVVGTEKEYQSIESRLKKIQTVKKVERIEVEDLSRLNYKKLYTELIICISLITYKKLIEIIKQLPKEISIKIHAIGSNGIIGSSSKDKPGNVIVLDDL